MNPNAEVIATPDQCVGYPCLGDRRNVGVPPDIWFCGEQFASEIPFMPTGHHQHDRAAGWTRVAKVERYSLITRLRHAAESGSGATTAPRRALAMAFQVAWTCYSLLMWG